MYKWIVFHLLISTTDTTQVIISRQRYIHALRTVACWKSFFFISKLILILRSECTHRLTPAFYLIMPSRLTIHLRITRSAWILCHRRVIIGIQRRHKACVCCGETHLAKATNKFFHSSLLVCLLEIVLFVFDSWSRIWIGFIHTSFFGGRVRTVPQFLVGDGGVSPKA